MHTHLCTHCLAAATYDCDASKVDRLLRVYNSGKHNHHRVESDAAVKCALNTLAGKPEEVHMAYLMVFRPGPSN